MWGIIPAAGRGSRIQPLAFSKELLPVGSRKSGESDRPVAVSEYLVQRMLQAGVTKLCFVISPDKSDILQYFGGRIDGADLCYAIQPTPSGLCDALFRALPFIGPDEWVVVGLPDTIWFPENALARLPDHPFSFALFPVEHPELFDAVELDEQGDVRQIHVKSAPAKTPWVWGAFKLRARVLRELFELWNEPGRHDEYFGSLVNVHLSRGNVAKGFRIGEAYVDVGTLNGYREARRLLEPAQ